ncbi:MAG: 5-(carboxyamino)imidazole ribonucleotide mutase [Zhaonellaceae bacterium]|jgi:5-(carboxyamino)imidazole ribonucleotide mutase|nr:5-(carboxyamino)imidazole ribonucleotide mutase [Clostridia bacterium]
MAGTKVGIIMGSDSDLLIMKQAADILDEFGIGYEVTISSAHRLPQATVEYALSAEKRGLEVIIAGAGAAAHLPGIIAAHTILPVIGVPIKSAALGGVDALYSIVQMPKGIPVATMAIDGAKNAGILAAQILALQDPELRKKLNKFKETMAYEVQQKGEKLKELGIEAYLKRIGKEKMEVK